jgi:hypothetical protein
LANHAMVGPMTMRVLILGGYGNFGSYVARALKDDPAITLIIAGRSLAKAQAFAAALDSVNPAEAAAVDIGGDLTQSFVSLRPGLIIHTVGPFQHQGYAVAEAAISAGAHYCDLADARTFVRNIGSLDHAARQQGVAIISGASSVPCLTAAYLDDAARHFAQIEAVDYGITAAQQTNRGLGTASAVLSYVGRPFTTLIDGRMQRVFGWQGLHSEVYPELGRRWFGYCDVPDLELFPLRYPTLKRIRFGAGHEIAILHFGTWLLSWGVRFGVLPRLDRWSNALLKGSFLFDWRGSARSGFHMRISGKGHDGKALIRTERIIARSGHGPNIPCIPAILIARRLAHGGSFPAGARPCLDLISLVEYLGALASLDITAIRA